MTSLDVLAMSAVLLFGVPHGGLDGAIARRSGWPKGFISWFGFNITYVLLAALVIWVWWQWPLLGLAVFLTISGLHFGSSDIVTTKSTLAEKPLYRWLPLLAHGGLVPIAIPNLQSLQVQPLFTLLVGEVGTTMLMNAVSLLFLPWLACFAVYCGYATIYPAWRKPLLNLIIVLILVFWLSPLVSFALYFCVWHSRCHTLRIWRSLKQESERRRSLIEAVIYSVAAWVAALGFYIVFQQSFTTALIQITFIGLAALTVPHMLLVDFADKLKRPNLWP